MDADLLLQLKQYTLQKMKEHPLRKKIKDHVLLLTVDDIIFNKPIETTWHIGPNYPKFDSGHKHEFFELNYMASGVCYQRINATEEIMLRRGNVLVMNPNAIHSCATPSPDDCLVNLVIRPELFQNMLLSFMYNNSLLGSFYLNYILPGTDLQGSYMFFQAEYDPYIDHIFENIIREKLENHPYADVNARNHLSLLFSELLRKNLTENGVNDERLTQIIEYMVSHIDHADRSSVAKAFFMHPNYLSSYIKKKTGQTFEEILANIKVTQAKNLLANTSISIEDISVILGYAEILSFHNMFKRRTGMTPGQYRKGQIFVL